VMETARTRRGESEGETRRHDPEERRVRADERTKTAQADCPVV
jgi:hypothetical protein